MVIILQSGDSTQQTIDLHVLKLVLAGGMFNTLSNTKNNRISVKTKLRYLMISGMLKCENMYILELIK